MYERFWDLYLCEMQLCFTLREFAKVVWTWTGMCPQRGSTV